MEKKDRLEQELNEIILEIKTQAEFEFDTVLRPRIKETMKSHAAVRQEPKLARFITMVLDGVVKTAFAQGAEYGVLKIVEKVASSSDWNNKKGE